MTSAEQHLNPEQLNAFVDRETTPGEALAIARHLDTCHACSLRIVSAMQLKRATAAAGVQVSPSPAALARLTAQLRTSERKRARIFRMPVFTMPRVAWTAAAAGLLFAIGTILWLPGHERNGLSAELLDQHLGALSAAAVPQVISADKHTVKPWFQGKLPFSFNLPEPASLPAETALRGGSLTYVDGQPAALLFFSVRKHQVSVFVLSRDRGPALSRLLSPNSVRSGFAMQTRDADHLELIGVSDVDPDGLRALLSVLVQAQGER